MKPLLFQLDRPRDPGKKVRHPGESIWNFLDTCGREKCADARAYWNSIVGNVNGADQPVNANRLLSCVKSNVIGCFFELVVCKMLNDQGIKATLNTDQSSEIRSDILIGSTTSPVAHLEATVRHPSMVAEQEGDAVYGLLRETAPLVHDQHLHVNLVDYNYSKTTPSRRRFAEWLNNHSDNIGMELTYHDPSSGWSLSLVLFKIDPRRSDHSFLAVGPMEAAWSNARESLTAILRSKRRQHAHSSTNPITCIAWNDFKTEPDREEMGWYLSDYHKETKKDICVLYFASCYPYGPTNITPVMFCTGSPPADMSWWPFDTLRI